MEWRGSKAWESSGQIFLCFKFTKQKFFLTRNLVCLNFLEMLIFTLSSFVYFCLVCFFEGEGWFRGWIEGNYMLAHLLCINFFHRTIWIFKDPSFSPPPSPEIFSFARSLVSTLLIWSRNDSELCKRAVSWGMQWEDLRWVYTPVFKPIITALLNK